MKSLTILVAVLALGTIAYAADEPAKPAPAPAAPPAAEGDKKPRQTPEAAFKKLDTDNSGDISLAEFKASPRGLKDPAKAEEMYKKMNTSNDGKVTLEQFTAARQRGEKKPQ